MKVLSSKKKILAVQYKSPLLLVGHPAETGNLSKIVPLQGNQSTLTKIGQGPPALYSPTCVAVLVGFISAMQLASWDRKETKKEGGRGS